MKSTALCALAALLCLHLPTAHSLIPREYASPTCKSFREVLTTTIVKIATSYFADNPRANATSLDPSSVVPLTPAALFRAYYGDLATAEHFKQAVLDIYFSDPDPLELSRKSVDRAYNRQTAYVYAEAGSYRLAREKLGRLIYKGVGDVVGSSSNWQKRRCLTASSVAKAENVVFAELERARNELGDYRFGRLLDLGAGTTLAFVIDETGSMAEEIDAAKTRAKMILKERQGSLDQPQDFVLVPFNDPLVGPLTATNDADVFTSAIESLEPYGGGDDPELTLEAILLAIENCRPGSSVFVITDVDAKDVELQDLVVAQAKLKSVKINFLLTDTITNTVCKDTPKESSSDLLKRRCLTASFKHGLELFEHIAESTGGKSLVVKEGDILRATEVVDSTVKQGIVDVFRKFVAGGTQRHSLRIDSSISELFVEFKGDCRDITIGHQDSIFMIEDIVTVGDLMEGRIPVNNNFGTWYINVTGSLGCDVNIKARSTKGFIKTLGKETTSRRSGIIGFSTVVTERFEGQPLHSDDVVILFDAYGNDARDRVDTVKFLSAATGALLSSYKVNALSSFFRVTPTSRPQQAFRVAVEGIDSRGFPFSRIVDGEVEFVRVEMKCVNLGDVIFRPGDTAVVNVHIRNFGLGEESLELSVIDSQHFVDGTIAPRHVSLAGLTGATVAAVTLTADATAVAGTSTAITVTAKSLTSEKLFYKTCHLVVGQRARPLVKEFHVTSDIKSRLAETTMRSTVENDANVGREAEFFVVLPTNAFISDFNMIIGNRTYRGTIEEKSRAKEIYRVGKAKQFTIGHVTARDQSSSVFQTSVNLAPWETVKFELTYQELLTRKNGKYTFGVVVRMLQPVDRFSILVSVCDSSPIRNLRVVGFDTEQTALSGPQPLSGYKEQRIGNSSFIFYKPTPQEQAQVSPYGLQGRFVIDYEVANIPGTNNLMYHGNFYVHFLVPTGFAMPKRVVFAIDASASMFGHKMSQLRTAMWNILDKLSPNDEFAIVTFNGTVKQWTPPGSNDSLVSATKANIQAAKTDLYHIRPQGGTNLLQVLYDSLQLLRSAAKSGSRTTRPSTDFVVLITDGRPTEGIVEMDKIQKHIYRFNNKTFAIHAVGLGTLVDMPALQKLAFQNKGTSTQVFLDIDAHVQIENFVDGISHPVLDNVRVEYPTRRVASTDGSEVPIFYEGQELIITGQLQDGGPATDVGRSATSPPSLVPITVRGSARELEVAESEVVAPRLFGECPFSRVQVQNVTARMYAFIRVKSLLREIAAAENQTKKEILRQRALDQSLTYGFVVPNITSMIVTKPGDLREIEDTISAEQANRPRAPAAIKTKSASAAPEGTRGFFAEELPDIDLSLLPKPAFDVKVEVIGDPHVVVELNENTRLCFNWMGQEDKVYNILHNNESDVTVNAKLVSGRRNFLLQRPCFVGEIGIIMIRKEIKIKIDPFLISAEEASGKTINLKTFVSARSDFFGIFFKIEAISSSSSTITIRIDNNLEFEMKAHYMIGAQTSRGHLDFAMAKRKGFSGATVGLLGPFSDDKAAETAEVTAEAGAEVGTLHFRDRKNEVTAFGVFDTYAKRRLKCWLLTNFLDVLSERQEEYEIPDIFTTQR